MERRPTSYRTAKPLSRDISESLGKLPPQAPDVEEAILGALLLEKNALAEIVDIIHADDFYLERHKIIFEAIVSLYHASSPVDMRTVIAQLRQVGKLELVEGASYVAELTSKVSSSANIEFHARIVIEMSMKRQLIEIASQIHHEAYDDTSDIFVMMEYIQERIDNMSGDKMKAAFQSLINLYPEHKREIASRQNNPDKIVGIRSGIVPLDNLLNGFKNAMLYIIAARPGMGKTAFLLSILRNMAVSGIECGFFSLEMAVVELMDRLISSESEVELEKIQRGIITMADAMKIDGTGILGSATMLIDDNPTLSILDLRARARRLKAKHGIKIIVVDYLQLMNDGGKGHNREQEIANISRGLKVLSKELNIPVIALAQLSRQTDNRAGDKRPQLSDLRESGSIEQDADIVAFLYRPEYYKIKFYEDNSSTHGVMEIIVAKHRNGRLDTVKARFLGYLTKVKNMDSDEPQGQQQAPPPTDKDDLPF